MASSSLDLLISRLLIKDEIDSIGLFTNEKDIQHHLHQVEIKFKELKINEKDKRDFLFKSLSENIKLELSALIDYEENYENYNYIKNKLIELYSKKKSTVSPYLELLKIKQLPGQTLKEYLSAIRIQGIKIFHSKPAKEREDLLVMAFISGLKNTKIAEILKQMKPDSLEKACKLIKYEYHDDLINEFNISAINLENCCGCFNYRKEIERLSKKVQQLKNLFQSQYQKRPSHVRTAQNTCPETRKCFNCGRTGHISTS